MISIKSYEVVPVEGLTPHPDNARRGSVGVIESSIASHGMYRPITVQESTRHIIAGNHTYQAAVAQGLTEVPIVVVDVDDTEARAIMLVDNRASDLAFYDDALLAESLQSLIDAGGGLDGTGFSQAALDDLLDALNTDIPAVLDPLLDRMAAHEETDIRQVVLIYRGAEFARVVELLDAVSAAKGLESNSEAVLWCLERFGST